MVKFGGHVEAFRKGDNRGTDLFLVPYNHIKGIIFQEEHSSCFQDAWNEALFASENDYRLARKDLWEQVFSVIAEKDRTNLRGAHPGNALKIYIENTHPDKARNLLTRMDQVHRAASVNIEALRKLIKKYDKHHNSEILSPSRLPALYTSSLYSSQHMLQDGIGLVRELLDEENQSFSPMIRLDSEAQYEQAVVVRMDEFNWLKRMVASISEDNLLPRLVAHRGFHHIQDRNDKRPLENSLSAYEMAWTSGIHLCECDIAITKDEKLVLAHDENFMRLALDASDGISHKRVSDLTFRELISMPLKSGVRPPLLIDVLRSACAISDHSQLVIEIKPGNEAAASALARLLIRHPDLRHAVAMIMSFDAVTMHRLRAELSIIDETEYAIPNSASQEGMQRHHRVTSFDHFGTMTAHFGSHHRRLTSMEKMGSSLGLSLSQNNLELSSTPIHGQPIVDLPKVKTLPNLMLLTVSDLPKRDCENRVSVDDFSDLESWLKNIDGALDGVYLQFERNMMTEAGAEALRKLSERSLVGIWFYSGKDPDEYETVEWLVRNGNCTFVNTDLPNHFKKDIFVGSTAVGA